MCCQSEAAEEDIVFCFCFINSLLPFGVRLFSYSLFKRVNLYCIISTNYYIYGEKLLIPLNTMETVVLLSFQQMLYGLPDPLYRLAARQLVAYFIPAAALGSGSGVSDSRAVAGSYSCSAGRAAGPRTRRCPRAEKPAGPRARVESGSAAGQ